MSDKNAVGHWIDYNGSTKFAETGPEMKVKAILEELQMKMGFMFKHGTQGYPLTVICESDDATKSYDLHPDFIITMPDPITWGQRLKAVEVDGVHHFTREQERKRRWRDSLLLKHRYDIIHIDARLPYSKNHISYLKVSIRKALEHGSPVEFIAY